jgi:hypothetical protein
MKVMFSKMTQRWAICLGRASGVSASPAYAGPDCDEMGLRSTFIGMRLTIFHFTHNARLYVGIAKSRRWHPCRLPYVFLSPYPLAKTLREWKLKRRKDF